jgi:hypothetical protein
MYCPDCFSTVYLIVDGKEMSEDELMNLRAAPKSIERKLTHKRWCPNHNHLVQLQQLDYSQSAWVRG